MCWSNNWLAGQSFWHRWLILVFGWNLPFLSSETVAFCDRNWVHCRCVCRWLGSGKGGRQAGVPTTQRLHVTTRSISYALTAKLPTIMSSLSYVVPSKAASLYKCHSVTYVDSIGQRQYDVWVRLFVCLSVCLQRNSKTNDPKVFKLGMTFGYPTGFGVKRSKVNVRFRVRLLGVSLNSLSAF